MKRFLVLVTLSIFFLKNTEGLTCYNCLHFSDQLPDGLIPKYGLASEPSCKSGSKPEKRLTINETGTSNALTAILGNNRPMLTSSNQATVTYACVKLTYDGFFGSEWGGKRMKATFRSCISKYTITNETFGKQCDNGKMNNLNITDTDVNSTVFDDALGPLMNNGSTDASICTCVNDDCNGAMMNTQLSMFIMISSVVAALLKQII